MQLKISKRFTTVSQGRWKLHYALGMPCPEFEQQAIDLIQSFPTNEEYNFSVSDFRAFFRLPGGWALVLEHERYVVALVDAARSIPILFSATAISDEVGELLAKAETIDYHAWDTAACKEFLDIGFVWGNDTLYKDIKQLQVGQLLWVDKLQTHEQQWQLVNIDYLPYTGITKSEVSALNREQAIDEIGDIEAGFWQQLRASLDTVMHRVVRNAQGRQIWVPLSGGMDSRLLATWLAEHKVEQVHTFTYGVGESKESKYSQQVAQSLGLKWHFVDYNDPHLAKWWNTSETEAWLAYNCNAVSLPHIQDWYALKAILMRGVMAEDAIIIPGHTPVAAYHGMQLAREIPVTVEQVKAEIWHHHANLQNAYQKRGNNAYTKAKLLVEIASLQQLATQYDPVINADMTANSFASLHGLRQTIEYVNIVERQAKYINNSVRSYEFFGLAWSMPMWEVEFRTAWAAASPEHAINRATYEKWVNNYFTQVSGLHLPQYMPLSEASEKQRAGVKAILARLHLLTFANRLLTAKATLYSHLGIQCFLHNRWWLYSFWQIIRGIPAMGQYSQMFLRGKWVRSK